MIGEKNNTITDLETVSTLGMPVRPYELMLFYDYNELATSVQEASKIAASVITEEALQGGFVTRVHEQGVKGEWEHDFFMLQINPRTLKVGKSKLSSSVLTKAGYETFHWGTYEMIPYSYTGATGRCDVDFRGRIVPDVRASIAWRYFECFKSFIDKRRDDIVMVYREKVYSGYFKDFSFDENADSPFSIGYSFTFLVYPDREVITISVEPLAG